MLGIGAHGALAARRPLGRLAEFRAARRLLLGLAAADGGAVAPTQARLLIGSSAEARRTASAFAAIASADLRPLLAATRMPLGVIWGTRDPTISPRGADHILALRPDARVVMIEAAGHILMAERPGAFRAALGELLGGLPQPATTPQARPAYAWMTGPGEPHG